MSSIQGIDDLNTRCSYERPTISVGRHTHAVVLVAVFVLVGIRALSEFGMMSLFGPDPQMPIWCLLILVKLAFWLTIGVLAWLPAMISNSRPGIAAAFVLLTLWAAAICWASWQYVRSSRALVDASSTATSAERLSELIHFDGIQAGYELDNRIASNPNTPTDTLRELHARNQLGTQMTLARNPNTPTDILEALADSNDEWMQRSLTQNPRLPESVRAKLKPPAK